MVKEAYESNLSGYGQLKTEIDLEYSNIFRRGLDLVVKEPYQRREVTQKTMTNIRKCASPFMTMTYLADAGARLTLQGADFPVRCRS